VQVLRTEPIEPQEEPTLDAFASNGAAATDPLAYPMVLVEWHDAWFDPDQADRSEFRQDYLVRTIGFLIDEGPNVITVAHEVLPDGDGFRAVTHIPVPIVRRIHRLWPGTDGSR